MQPQSSDNYSIGPTPGGKQDTSIKYAQSAVNGAHVYDQPDIADGGEPTKLSTPSAGVPVATLATPGQAVDSDQIERDWIEVVKRTLIDTRDDPFEQSSALARLRADYIKKRYNKDIKVPEG